MNFLQKPIKQLILILLSGIILSWFSINTGFAFPIQVVDDSGKTIVIEKMPKRVVSLVPAITEIIFKLNAQSVLKGITYHTKIPADTSLIKVVGGFSNPSLKAVASLHPDLIFVSSLHKGIQEYFKNKNVKIIKVSTHSVSQGLAHILLLGKIFNKNEKAGLIKKQNDDQIELIRKKIALIAPDKRKRVLRIMGRDTLMTPGADSFQNEIISLAGGIPHNFKKNGSIIKVNHQEWIKFNPQVIYGCGNDSKVVNNILTLPEWKDVSAVKNKRIYYFPCDLTCRAASNTGFFVQWLAASIYGKEFASEQNRILGKKIKTIRKINCDLDYIQNIKIDETNIFDFKNRTLVIKLKKPMVTFSTLEGQRDGINTLINHYTPPQNWLIDHKNSIDAIRMQICSALNLDKNTTSILITGVDMNNLVIKKESYKELSVYAFITAGVNSNAMRMGRDRGDYYEPGTINIIIMSNMQMSNRAMARAVITATEAKTAALLDLDIRTSYENGAYRATGTGTDNVLLVQGKGQILDNSGGHTKLGELIAKAVTKGVKEAIAKQNHINVKRNIFLRLKKRGISISDLIAQEECDCGKNKNKFAGEIENLLLNPRYAGFVEIALALSDDYEKGLIKDISTFEKFSNSISMEICVGNMEEPIMFLKKAHLPLVIEMALNALFNGVYHRNLK